MENRSFMIKNDVLIIFGDYASLEIQEPVEICDNDLLEDVMSNKKSTPKDKDYFKKEFSGKNTSARTYCFSGNGPTEKVYCTPFIVIPCIGIKYICRIKTTHIAIKIFNDKKIYSFAISPNRTADSISQSEHSTRKGNEELIQSGRRDSATNLLKGIEQLDDDALINVYLKGSDNEFLRIHDDYFGKLFAVLETKKLQYLRIEGVSYDSLVFPFLDLLAVSKNLVGVKMLIPYLPHYCYDISDGFKHCRNLKLLDLRTDPSNLGGHITDTALEAVNLKRPWIWIKKTARIELIGDLFDEMAL